MAETIRFGGLLSRDLFRRSVMLQGGRVPRAFHVLALIAALGSLYLARGEDGELKLIPLAFLAGVVLLEAVVLAAVHWLPDILWSRTVAGREEAELRVVGELGDDGLTIESGAGVDRAWASFEGHTASQDTLLLNDPEAGPVPLFREHFADEEHWRQAQALVASKLPQQKKPGAPPIPFWVLAVAWLVVFLLGLWLLSL